MSDERKPVVCPWCGWDMVAREGQDIFHGKYNVYVCDGCEATSPIAYSEDTAYAAATKRPPNLPLTREQVEAMPDLAAVWVFVEERYKPTIITAERAMLRYQGDTVLPFHSDAMLFAAPPTPADIAAARNAK